MRWKGVTYSNKCAWEEEKCCQGDNPHYNRLRFCLGGDVLHLYVEDFHFAC